MNGSEAFRAVRRARPFERDGRKVIVTSNGTDLGIVLGQRVDNAMVKALARAFRRRTLLETGSYGTIEEPAAMEKINSSYVSRSPRLTLLALQPRCLRR
jgi:hypothetical protein